MKRFLSATLIVATLLTAGCGGDGSGSNDGGGAGGGAGGSGSAPPDRTTAALFQPSQGVLPYPTDLLFKGTTDSTINIQPPAGGQLPSTQAAVNALDGFSVNSVIRARFGSAIDSKTLTPTSVRVFQVTVDSATKLVTGPGVGVETELKQGTDPATADFSVGLATDSDDNGSTLEIRPLKRLAGTGVYFRGFVVMLTNEIKTTTGAAVTADVDFAAIKAGPADCTGNSDTATCTLINNNLLFLRSQGIDTTNVVLAFSFSTQDTRATLDALANPQVTKSQPIAVANTGATTKDLIGTLPGHATLFKGTITVPYYSSRPTAANPTAPLTASWKGGPSPLDPNSTFLTRTNPLPVATETVSIPLLVTVPNASAAGGGQKPASGWPVLVFQHGLTRNRLDAVALADSFADAGYVVASIDLPLHGIGGADAVTANPFYDASNERTFNLDFVNNDTLAPGPDGKIDPSGTHFINLASLLTTRDNLRQSAADLLTLVRSLPNLSLDGDSTPDVDPTRIHFIGHSLGAIAGGVFLGVTRPGDVVTGELANPGGAVAQTIFDSPAFGQQLRTVLAAQGIKDATRSFAEFVRDAQTVVDAGDPLNYVTVAATNQPLLLFQVVGGGTLADGSKSLPDQVVVNSATQRLINAANLRRVSAVGDNIAPSGSPSAFVNFVLGAHGSIIDPSTNLATTVEMQTQSIVFASSLGSDVRVSDGTVVQQ